MSASLTVAVAGRVGALGLDLGLEVPLQGVTLITGPSGAGKTTLLRCIAGLTRLKGRITVAGQVWQDGARFTPPHRREVGYVFQDAQLFAHLSVEDNLRFGARRQASATDAVEGLSAAEVIGLLTLSPLLRRGTAQLSGGERQRVAIGRALLSRPRLLLMDEPTASLDPEARGDVVALIGRLATELATPVLVVSHDPGGLAHLAQRRIRIAAGRIVDAGTASPVAADGLEGIDGATRDGLARAALAAGLAPLDAKL